MIVLNRRFSFEVIPSNCCRNQNRSDQERNLHNSGRTLHGCDERRINENVSSSHHVFVAISCGRVALVFRKIYNQILDIVLSRLVNTCEEYFAQIRLLSGE